MYLQFEVIRQALTELQSLHPFFGITYLVCKKAQLPVGKTIPFAINHQEQEFLEKYYKPDPKSKFFFQPFRTSGSRWLSPKYPSSGSQSTRTRGHLAQAFIHARNTDRWGWNVNYVQVLAAQLAQDQLPGIPAFWLAAWIYRHTDWSASSSAHDLEETLFADFHISSNERVALFITEKYPEEAIFVEDPYSDRRLLQIVKSAPDSSPEEGGTLRLLEMRGIGPSAHLQFYPAERLSIITGDNGLGKTFILECAWWALTGHWAERPAYPNLDAPKTQPAITLEIAARETHSGPRTIRYDWQRQEWPAPKGRPTLPGLIVYARVDGSFAVWDPARYLRKQQALETAALVFSRDEVLRGLEGHIEGLLRDWVRWQNSKDQLETFNTFCAVLKKLSPPDMSPLSPGSPIRIPGEPRRSRHSGILTVM